MMPPANLPAIEFRSPVGLRVRVVTMLVFVVLLLIAALPLVFPRPAHSPIDDWAPLFAPTIGLPIVVPIMVLARVKGYRLVGEELQVVRVGRVTRIPLAGLLEVEANPRALEHAWKMWGNDGLGAITGRFRSRKLGRFDALLADPAEAVVLRWPGRTLVVSPERAPYFVACVRERLNMHA